METAVITISQYCTLHRIDPSFIISLSDEGLISLQAASGQEDAEENYIVADDLPVLELYTRWHSELGINLEGIDVIRHLLERIRHMQAEITELKNRLRLYEKYT